VQTGMMIIFMSASMRDIPRKARAGPAVRTAGPGPASSWQQAWMMTTRAPPQEAHRMAHRIGPTPFRSVFSCRVLPAPLRLRVGSYRSPR
jgi:hypothetical protein